MTKERIEKELSKVDAQLESLQAKKKDFEEQKHMAEDVYKRQLYIFNVHGGIVAFCGSSRIFFRMYIVMPRGISQNN